MEWRDLRSDGGGESRLLLLLVLELLLPLLYISSARWTAGPVASSPSVEAGMESGDEQGVWPSMFIILFASPRY